MKISINAIISLFLVTIIMLCSACTGGGSVETTAPVTTEEPEVTEAPINGLLLISDADTDCKVIRGSYASEAEQSAATSVYNALKRKYADIIDKKVINDDWIKGVGKNEVYEGDELEIVIGYTNRKESRDVHAELSVNEYAIRVVGNKLIIIGYDEFTTSSAATEFIKNYVEPADTTAFYVPRDLNVKGKAELRQVAINSEASYRIMTWNLGVGKGVEKDAITVIHRYFPDILCLQEANKGVHQDVVEKMPEYMSYATKFHSNGSTYVYTPIIYNSNLFTLVDSGVEWLDGRYPYTNTKSVAWAVFKDKSNETFAVINFHGAVCSADYKGYESMTSAERNQIALNWRIDNVRQVIEIKDRIIKKQGDIPVMVMGDCNFNQDSVPYANMTKAGFVTAEETARLSKVTGYATYFSYGTSIKTGKSIDHIFQLGGIDFVAHMIVRDKLVETASDHCPVYTDFNITKK